MTSYYSGDWLNENWSDWVPLDPEAGAVSKFPAVAGLYRMRHQNSEGLEYVGETGRSIRGRVLALRRGVYAEEMPFRDPHTAAPCLWAVRQEVGPEFEVSIAVPQLAEDKQPRKAFEEALIASYRRDAGESPTANFGRIIPGYKQSSYRKSSERGGPLSEDETESNSELGVGPLPWTDREDITGSTWMGLDWTSPIPLSDADSSLPSKDGVYRIWRNEVVPPLEYVGQTSNLRSRLYRHRHNREETLRFSYVVLEEHSAQHKREEIETELIGAHWVATGESPRDQF